MHTSQQHYRQIADALPFLTGEDRLVWQNAAARAGLSPYYFQRIFKQHVGVSPKQYAAHATLSDIKQRLTAGDNVLEAALAAGLSGSGRAHDLFVSTDAATPGDFARGGCGVSVDYGVAASPYGDVFVAATHRGVCLLSFLGDDAATNRARAWKLLQRRWWRATFNHDNDRAAALTADIFGNGVSPLDVRGTNFQINVWRALLMVPAGKTVSYSALTRAVCGNAKPVRAVAAAVGANPVSVLIPCHRVIGINSALTGYAWGLDKKRALLAREFAMTP